MPSQFLAHLPFTLIATTSVQYNQRRKKERDWNNYIFYFCMRCIEKNVVPSVMAIVCCMFDCVERETLTWNQCCLLQIYSKINQMLSIWCASFTTPIVNSSLFITIQTIAILHMLITEQFLQTNLFLSENVSVVDMDTLDRNVFMILITFWSKSFCLKLVL